MDEVEKNKTVEKDMKKLVNKSWFRYWLSAEMSNSYERLQSLSFCYSIIPVLKKLYPNKEEFGEAIKRHLNFFNTEGRLIFLQGSISAPNMSVSC